MPSFTFDPNAVIEPERQYYKGLLAAGDQVVWLGEEKHRKSNLLLQFLICAATGRDFLGFPFEGEPLRGALIDFETSSKFLESRRAAIVKALDAPHLEPVVCYQSRVGPLEWIGPATDAEIRRAGQHNKGAIVAPIAFVSEHSETLVELDIEYRRLARESGDE